MSESIYTYLNRNLYRNTSVNNLSTSDAESVSQLSNSTMVTTDQVYADTLLSGEIDGTISFTGGFIQSKNFVSGVSGWRLSADGTLEAVDAILSGAISATSGTIGAFEIGTDYIRDVANSFGLASTVTGGDDVRFWAGDTYANRATADFRITESGAVTASSITITGGSIAGTPISSIPNNSSTDISLLEATHDLVFSVTDKDTVAWATGTITLSNGRTFSISSGNTGNMAARTYIYLDTGTSTTVLQTTTTASTAMGANKKLIAVAQNGTAQAQFTVYGGIGGIKLPASGTSVSNNNWAYSGAWSVTDADTVAWGSGTLTTSDGGSYSISGSNTGNMAAKTYIYFDLGTSSTAFQTTTTASSAVGDGKILIAISQNGTTEANYIVVNDKQLNIDAANIVAGSITANEISAGAVTATKIDVSQLSAITADLGSITAGTIVLPSGGYIRSGQTAYDSGTGFYIGNDSSVPKMSIGNSSGSKLIFNGTSLQATNINVVRSATAGEAFTGATTSQAAFIGDDTTTLLRTSDSSASNFSFSTVGKLAHKWTPTINEVVNYMTIRAERDAGMSSDIRAGIQADTAGEPSGTFLGYVDIPASNFSVGSESLVTSAVFNNDVDTVGGTAYWFVVQMVDTAETDPFYIDRVTTGSETTSTYGGTWTTDTSSDSGIGWGIKYTGGRLFKSDGDVTERAKFHGFVISTAALGASVDLLFTGASTFSGLTPGDTYYIQNTRGTIGTTPGGTSVEVGIALSATELLTKSY